MLNPHTARERDEDVALVHLTLADQGARTPVGRKDLELDGAGGQESVPLLPARIRNLVEPLLRSGDGERAAGGATRLDLA